MMPETKKCASLNPVAMLTEEDDPNNISGSDQTVEEPYMSKTEANYPKMTSNNRNATPTDGEGNYPISEPNPKLPAKRETLLPQVVTNLKQEIQKAGWIPYDAVKKNTHIERCHPIIMDNIKFLAHEYSKKQSEIARLSLYVGIMLLWTFDEIGEILEIRTFVHRYSDDQDDREFFSSTKFEGLESTYAKQLHIEFFERDVKQCDGLASELGLTPGTVRQLALMAGLIHAPQIPYGDRARMVGILKKFSQWLKRRVKRAQEIKRMVQERQTSSPQPTEDRPTSWNDVIEDR